MGQQGEPCVVRRQNAERERGQVSAKELYWQDVEHRTCRRAPPTLVCFFNTVLRGEIIVSCPRLQMQDTRMCSPGHGALCPCRKPGVPLPRNGTW